MSSYHPPPPPFSARGRVKLATAAAFTALAGGCLGAGATADPDPSGSAEDTAKASVSPRTVVGPDAPRYTHMVSLSRDGVGYCSGAVVSPNAILTAAHCVVDGAPDAIFVGSRLAYEVGSSGVEIGMDGISGVIIHDDYINGKLSHDLALIGLKEPLHRHYSPLELNEKRVEDLVGEEVTALGWSSEEAYGERHMKEVSVPVIDTNECSLFPYYYQVDDTMGCTYHDSTVTSCGGDPGGPVFLKEPRGRYLMVGVSSWGDNCNDSGRPGVWADVQHHLEWIREKIEFFEPGLRASTFTRAEGDERDPEHSAGKAIDGDTNTLFWSHKTEYPKLRLFFDGNRRLGSISLNNISSQDADNTRSLPVSIKLFRFDDSTKEYEFVAEKVASGDQVKWEQSFHWTAYVDGSLRDVAMVEIEQYTYGGKGHFSIGEVTAFLAE